jgi:uncharacterized YccA/Bax inhibitor family protein
LEGNVRSSNPVLSRLGRAAQDERSGSYAQPQFGTQYAQPQFGQPGYGITPPSASTRMMTLDDVVVRTIALLVLTGVAGALSWTLLPSTPVMWVAVAGSSIAGVVLGLVISFARITNPLLIGAYAVLQGVLLGAVSRVFERAYSGIVIQAVIGTFGVFAIMAVLYKFKVLRATPRFTRGVIGALIGVVVLGFVNFIVAMFGGNLHLIEYSTTGKVGWLPIVFSLVCIVVGALTFILDFDAVDQGVRYGLPERYAWYCAFGLLVGLIFLYWQILRLLSYMRR